MSHKEITSADSLSAGQRRHGFWVKRIENIPEIRVTSYELIHEATGAQVLHLHCDDPENLFAVAFRTPPRDSTGTPHILEHAVLAGSKRYPLKDVFNELMKGSLTTFINAFTYPDKTIYPVASQTRADYFNLARVYADLVFRPRLLRETFLQEGHHLEFADPETVASDLVTSGIVYNEMKGAYSSPDTLMYKAIQEGIFFDHPYAFDSGGNPQAIPGLTYEALTEFHAAYYSPTNARFFLYGNIGTEEHLVLLAEILAGYGRVDINSSIPVQRRRKEPIRISTSYPLAKEEPREAKTIVNMAWLLAENTDYKTALLLEIVVAALVGNAASPLRKALIDSGLGQDLSPVTGLERDLRELVFAVGLRGADPDKVDAIEELILRTLQETCRSGFERELIEGVIHQVEFHGREIVRAGYPYGIVLMGRVFHSWLYDGDPLVGLNLPAQMAEIRRQWQEYPRLFADIIKTWLLDNRHRVLSVMLPSWTIQEEEAEARRQEMARLKSAKTPEQLEQIRQEAIRLRKYQAEPDPPTAAACLPRLSLKEVSPQADRIPSVCGEIKAVPVLFHEIFTNGIGYLDLAFDIGGIPDEIHQYLPLLGKITLNMGAGGLSYEEMAKRLALAVGGIGYNLGSGAALGSGLEKPAGAPVWQKLILRVKFLYRNIEAAMGLVGDLLCAGDLTHRQRLTELIQEKKNDLHASVIPSGHIFARRSAAAGINLSGRRDEQWHGLTQLRFLNQIVPDLPASAASLAGVLAELRPQVFGRDNLLINLTADQEGLDLMTNALTALVDRLPRSRNTEPAAVPPFSCPVRQGFFVPSQVSYVAQALAAPLYDDIRSPYLTIIARFLATGYLYQKIRVQGGAYGAMSVYEPLNGIFALLSYRDPHILETLAVYRQAGQYLSSHQLTREELDKAIIGTIAGLDRPTDPAGRGYTALIRHFSGIEDAQRDEFRRRILAVTTSEIRQAADSYFPEALAGANIGIYGNQEDLMAAQPQIVGLTVRNLL